MRRYLLMVLALCLGVIMAATCVAQPVQPCPCPGGPCPIGSEFIQPAPVFHPVQVVETLNVLNPLDPSEDVDLIGATDTLEAAFDSETDVLDWIIKATVRVTVGNDCGSGTIVGPGGLILTNAHVAGSQKGRVVNVQRWDQLGETYKGTAKIIASGYFPDLNIDFALLRASDGFADGVKPIPMADRLVNKGRVTTSGCPRCEWPSTQSLKMIRGGDQVMEWLPRAISGRSGSGVIDYTDSGPKLIGLLTWQSKERGTGLGQSSKMVLAAIRGKIPTSFEPLPAGIEEVGTAKVPSDQREECSGCGHEKDECT